MSRVAFDIPSELAAFVQELQGELWNGRDMEQGGGASLPTPSEAILWWLQRQQDERKGQEAAERRQIIIDDLNPETRIPF